MFSFKKTCVIIGTYTAKMTKNVVYKGFNGSKKLL